MKYTYVCNLVNTILVKDYIYTVFETLHLIVQVSLEGIVRTAEEEDDYLQQRGPLQRFQNQFGCVQDIVRYRANQTAIPQSGVISGMYMLPSP